MGLLRRVRGSFKRIPRWAGSKPKPRIQHRSPCRLPVELWIVIIELLSHVGHNLHALAGTCAFFQSAVQAVVCHSDDVEFGYRDISFRHVLSAWWKNQASMPRLYYQGRHLKAGQLMVACPSHWSWINAGQCQDGGSCPRSDIVHGPTQALSAVRRGGSTGNFIGDPMHRLTLQTMAQMTAVRSLHFSHFTVTTPFLLMLSELPNLADLRLSDARVCRTLVIPDELSLRLCSLVFDMSYPRPRETQLDRFLSVLCGPTLRAFECSGMNCWNRLMPPAMEMFTQCIRSQNLESVRLKSFGRLSTTPVSFPALLAFLKRHANIRHLTMFIEEGRAFPPYPTDVLFNLETFEGLLSASSIVYNRPITKVKLVDDGMARVPMTDFLALDRSTKHLVCLSLDLTKTLEPQTAFKLLARSFPYLRELDILISGEASTQKLEDDLHDLFPSLSLCKKYSLHCSYAQLSVTDNILAHELYTKPIAECLDIIRGLGRESVALREVILGSIDYVRVDSDTWCAYREGDDEITGTTEMING